MGFNQPPKPELWGLPLPMQQISIHFYEKGCRGYRNIKWLHEAISYSWFREQVKLKQILALPPLESVFIDWLGLPRLVQLLTCYTCRTTVIFGTLNMLKDDSLQINSLASNICFSCRNVFQNSVNALSKWLTIFFSFLSKSSKILGSSDHTILFKFHQHVVHILIWNVWRDFRLNDVSISNGNIKYPIGTSIFE